jgi:Trypsin
MGPSLHQDGTARVDAAEALASQVQENNLSESSFPARERTWGEYFQKVAADVARKSGFASAMFGVGIAAGTAEQEVQGGFVTDAGAGFAVNDAAAVARGVPMAVANGGRIGSVRVEHDDGLGGRTAGNFTGWLYNNQTLVTSAHGFQPFLSLNPTFSFIPYANYNTAGQRYNVESFVIHPDYNGEASRSFAPDIVVAKLSSPVDTTITIPTFASSPVASGSVIEFSGYGKYGSLAMGELGQNGDLRNGTLTARTDTSLFSNISRDFYNATRFSSTILDNLQPKGGDSGSLVTNPFNSELLGIMTGAENGNDAVLSYYLDLTVPSVQNFIASNSFTSAVPEPSSSTLVGLATAFIGFFRQRKK